MASDAEKAAVVAVGKAYRAFVSDARLTVAEAQAVATVMLDAVPADVLARLAAERLTAEAKANQPAMQTWTCPPDSGAAAGATTPEDRPDPFCGGCGAPTDKPHEAGCGALDCPAPGATLVVGIHFPGVNPRDPDHDPELFADNVALILNEERQRNGGYGGDVEVDLFPAPQWLTADTLAKLRAQVAGATTVAPPEVVVRAPGEFAQSRWPAKAGEATVPMEDIWTEIEAEQAPPAPDPL